jgi:hypothetical protein
VPKEVGAPGELKVSGKHLDAVTTWRLGQVALSPAQAASAGKVVLTVIPADAPTDQPLIAVTQGREFASKKPVATVKTPIVAAWRSGQRRAARASRASSAAPTSRARPPSPRRQAAQDQASSPTTASSSRSPRPPRPAKLALKAKAGKYSGAPVEVDGAGGRLPRARRSARRPAPDRPQGLRPRRRAARPRGQHPPAQRGRGRRPAGTRASEQVAALGLRLAQDLQRVALAQAAVCSAMTTGKGKEQAATNAAAGELLRQSKSHAQALGGGLQKLWATLKSDALAGAGLAEVDAAVAALIAAGPKVQAACKNRFHGEGKLVTEASTTVTLDVPRLYNPAVLAAFADVLAQGKSWTAVEKAVAERLAALPASRRKALQDVLKASKAAVEAAASGGVTGKGAKGDKHVETQGKPSGNAGKGKGK